MSGGVYPRAYGGTIVWSCFKRGPCGLSRAYGEPPRWVSASVSARVYPRAYGGTRSTSCRSPACRGLSPRVRGNPGYGKPNPCTKGLSPRVRGTVETTQADNPNRVYPRAYGGTAIAFAGYPGTHGLSPRVRGNHTPATRMGYRVRSIPARTGEPSMARSFTWMIRVYPRAYGGTSR